MSSEKKADKSIDQNQDKFELLRTKRLFEAIFKNSQDAIMTLEPPSWRFTSGNPTALAMFGVKDEAQFIKNVPWLTLSPEKQSDGRLSKEKAQEMIKIAMERGFHSFEWTHRRMDGENFPAMVWLTRIDTNDKIFCQATVKDLTETKKIENLLRLTEERFKVIYDHASDGILVADATTKKLLFGNPKICELTGYSENELKKLRMVDIHPKKDEELVTREFDRQSKGLKVIARNIPVLRKDKKIIYCDVNATPTILDGKSVMLGFFRDSTARRQAEASLKETLYFFRESQRAANIGSYKTDFHTGTWESSEVLDKIFGIGPTYKRSIEGWLDLVHPNDKEKMDNYLKNSVLRDHKPFNMEYRIVRKSDGQTRWVYGAGKIYFDKKDEPTELIGVIQDITERKNAEELIKTRDAQLETILESTADGILTVDDDGKILQYNKRFLELWRIPKSVVKKKDDKVLLDFVVNQVKDPESFLKKIKTLYQSNDINTDTIQFMDGRLYERTSFPMIRGKERIGRVWSFSDVTNRKIAEEKLLELKDRSEAILASIGDAVFACDKSGKILIFNKMAELMTGVSIYKAVGQHFNKVINFVRESDGSSANEFITQAIEQNKITNMKNHVLLLRKDGGKIPVADSAAPIKDSEGNILGCVVVFHDMTVERKIDKAKTEFVSLASHQLRTPLSTINWYSEILLSEDIGTLNPKQQQYSKEVYHASQRMVALVNALLNVSRLELGTFAVDPKKVSIIKIAKMCIKELKHQIILKKLTVKEKYDKDLRLINVDPKLMGIVFQNLLSNSVKYSKNDGKIELSIGKHNGEFLISVSDNGIGIPSSQQKDIFSKLFRADNAKTTDPDGSGLGLYIVKEIITYTGGKVWFESREGKGTTFYASLPMSGMQKKVNTKQLI